MTLLTAAQLVLVGAVLVVAFLQLVLELAGKAQLGVRLAAIGILAGLLRVLEASV